jgi:UDP:flavonoid glycosyltransferase YjiC (YdhE family)
MSIKVACFAMSAPSHFRPTLAVASELVRAGATVRFWANMQFRAEVEAAGAEFADLFAPVALAEVDDRSIPVPSRWVTFAASQGARVAAEVLAWGAAVVVYYSFAVIGEVVGRRLTIPWVPVFAMHLIDAATMRHRTAAEPRVMTDPRCVTAAATLAQEFGMPEASPFCYFADPSPGCK